jgi:4-amino-4-deoxy-L-arabinose transferase-like glycosyltransferase
MKDEPGPAFRPRVIGIAGLYGGLAAAIFFLAFCNLDGRLFWGDEAETALLARNILKFGVPKVDDGLNHISLHGDPYDARDGVWTWSPWLPDYVTAASFALFGTTTWAGRAPFAFIGWLAVLLLGLVAWRIYRRHRIALSSMFLLGTSEVFLLHIRQCRYYSITVLAEIMLAYGIYQILARNKNGPWWILAGMTLQFYCSYTSAVANLPALLILGWAVFQKDRAWAGRLMASLANWLLICVPWLLFAETWRQASAEGRKPWMEALGFYAWQFHFHFFPWCFALLPICGWLFQRLSLNAQSSSFSFSSLKLSIHHALAGTSRCDVLDRRMAENTQSTVLGFEKYLLLLSALYLPVLLIMPDAFSRYLLPLLPLICLLVAAWLFRYLKWTAVAAAIILLQSLTNLPAVATDPFAKQYPLRSPIADFLFSSLLPYQDRLTDLLKFFDQHARPGDVLVSRDPEFPLIFYTRLKVVDLRLTPHPPPRPDWILPKSATGDLGETVTLPAFLKPDYETIVINVHDSPQEDNIPEPDGFQLETAKARSPFIIYHLKERAIPRAGP